MINWIPLSTPHLLPKISGVYVVRFRPTGQEYVGISKNIRRRAMRHRSAASLDSYLHRVIRTEGLEWFDVALLEEGEVDALLEMEIRHIAARGSFAPGGYNLTRGGGIIHTATHSAERRAAAAEVARRTHLGVKRSDVTRARLSQALMGKSKMTLAGRAALAARNTGKTMPDHTRAAIRKSLLRPVLVWGPEALLPVEYASVQEATRATGKHPGTVQYLLKVPRASRDGYAYAYLA